MFLEMQVRPMGSRRNCRPAEAATQLKETKLVEEGLWHRLS